MTLLETIAGTGISSSVTDLKKISRQINLLSLKSIQTKPLQKRPTKKLITKTSHLDHNTNLKQTDLRSTSLDKKAKQTGSVFWIENPKVTVLQQQREQAPRIQNQDRYKEMTFQNGFPLNDEQPAVFMDGVGLHTDEQDSACQTLILHSDTTSKHAITPIFQN